MATFQIYLASASPRRRELLRQIGVAYRLLPVAVDETPLPDEKPHAYVARLARAKAEAGVCALGRRRPAPVLGADTAVVVDGAILGKPGDRDEGLAMLARLSGREHRVLSAVALATEARDAFKIQESRFASGICRRRNARLIGTAANHGTRPAATAFKGGRRPSSWSCTAATPG